MVPVGVMVAVSVDVAVSVGVLEVVGVGVIVAGAGVKVGCKIGPGTSMVRAMRNRSTIPSRMDERWKYGQAELMKGVKKG